MIGVVLNPGFGAIVPILLGAAAAVLCFISDAQVASHYSGGFGGRAARPQKDHGYDITKDNDQW